MWLRCYTSTWRWVGYFDFGVFSGVSKTRMLLAVVDAVVAEIPHQPTGAFLKVSFKCRQNPLLSEWILILCISAIPNNMTIISEDPQGPEDEDENAL